MAAGSFIFILIVAAGLLGFCSSQSLQTSCGERCGKDLPPGARSSGCNCGSLCKDDNINCCDDYPSFCGLSCRRRCNQPYHTSYQCQCQPAYCEGRNRNRHNNETKCCDDYDSMCTGSARNENLHDADSGRAFPLSFISFVPPTDPPKPKEIIPISKVTGKVVVCPPGVDFFPCFVDPCVDLVCPKHRYARCVIDECGSCSAHFEVNGEKVDCSDRSVCAHGQRVFDCRYVDLCSDKRTCEAHPDAMCVENNCGGCFADFYDRDGKLVVCTPEVARPTRCPNYQSCVPRPCNQKRCKRYPTASCRNVQCGECRAEFFDRYGNVVDCGDDDEEPEVTTCPNGLDPCTNAICESINLCPGQSNAACRVDPCGDCTPKYYDSRGNEFTEYDCAEKDECPSDQRFCSQEPCSVERCAAHSDARCVNVYCDTCRANFYDRDTGRRLSISDCEVKRGICPDGSHNLNCEDSCKREECAAHPNARCEADPCNRCRVKWYDSNNNRVSCRVQATVAPSHPYICAGKCGESSNGGCKCDYSCLIEKNCCPNFQQDCGAKTCRNRCGKYVPFADCQCNSDCKSKGNCCSDFEELCYAGQSCRGKCHLNHISGASCQCHRFCHRTNNCCPDRNDVC